MIRTAPDDGSFHDWPALLALLRSAFASMEGRIAPPSSLDSMDAAALAAKARTETLILAREDGALAGCAFASARPDALYIGKLAADPARQGRGIGRALMAEAERLARADRLPALELSSRVELTENHRFFEALGFARTAATAHPGYDRPTSLTFRKPLA